MTGVRCVYIAEQTMSESNTTVLEIHITPEQAPKRRYRYHRRQGQNGYWRTEYEWTGCLWRLVDRQALTGLSVHQELDQ